MPGFFTMGARKGIRTIAQSIRHAASYPLAQEKGGTMDKEFAALTEEEQKLVSGGVGPKAGTPYEEPE